MMKPKFDFEIGYLVKSPCRTCGKRDRFPACIDDCGPINAIQTTLAHGVASVRPFSPLEAYALSKQGWERE